MFEMLFVRDNLGIAVILGMIALLFIIFLFLFGRKTVNPFLGTVGILGVAACLFLAFASLDAKVVYLETGGDVQVTVRNFYNSLLARDYETAYGYLYNYRSLGLEKEPEGREAGMLYQELQDAYRYELVGEPEVEQLRARQRVRFTTLDLGGFYDDVADVMSGLIDEMVQSRPRKESYDDDGNYRPEFLEEAYLEAFRSVFLHCEEYRISREYDVVMEYRGGEWLIVVNDEMLQAFQGEMK